MKVQEVEIFIAPDGTMSFEVRGVTGRHCLDLTLDLEEDLGGFILERIETSEMTVSEIENRTTTTLFTRS